MDIWFGVGPVISLSFKMFFRNLGVFLALFAIGYVPAFVAIAAMVVLLAAEDAVLASLAAFLAVVILAFATMLLSGGVMHAVYHLLRGRRVSVGDCVSATVSRIFQLIGVSIVVGFLYMLGVVACVIPGIIVICMFWVVIPVVVVERLGVFDAMGRSRFLTQGHRLEIFGIMAVFYVLNLVASFGIGMLAPAAAGTDTAFWMAQGAQWLVQAVFSGVTAVAVAVSYYALRIEVDGLGVEEFAQVFE